MTRDLRPLALAAVACQVIGCASGGSSASQGYQQQHVIVDASGSRFDLLLTRDQTMSSDTLALPAARAWRGLVQTYAGFGVPLQGVDGQSYMIATQPVHAHGSFAGERLSRWIDCGQSITGDIATSYEVTLRFGTLLDTSEAGRSIVRTALSASAIAPGSGTTPVDCSSRGAFEKRIVALTAAKSQ
jgi:hypothetical protein